MILPLAGIYEPRKSFLRRNARSSSTVLVAKKTKEIVLVSGFWPIPLHTVSKNGAFHLSSLLHYLCPSSWIILCESFLFSRLSTCDAFQPFGGSTGRGSLDWKVGNTQNIHVTPLLLTAFNFQSKGLSFWFASLRFWVGSCHVQWIPVEMGGSSQRKILMRMCILDISHDRRETEKNPLTQASGCNWYLYCAKKKLYFLPLSLDWSSGVLIVIRVTHLNLR